MLVFPHIKINLGLLILNKREDGYHNLCTLFYPVKGCTDALEVTLAKETEFVFTGLPIPGPPTDNLVWKAYNLLKNKFQLPPLRIHLHKVVPMGAGVGGGSADAAFALTTISEVASIEVDADSLKQFALQLGSDCPFFLQKEPMLGTGRGEILETNPISLRGLYIKVVFNEKGVSTAEAFRNVVPNSGQQKMADILLQPIENWKNVLYNQFEESIFNQMPQLRKVKADLYDQGALYASMTGSGSAIFGLFKENPGHMDGGWQMEQGSKVWIGKL